MRKIILVMWLALSSLGNANASNGVDPVHVQLLGINDFHGNLEPPTGSVGKINGVDAGGVEYLATHIKAKRLGHQYSVTVSAGDLFGASPLLSAMFKEEPTVEAMNLMGLDFNAVGNHEFDKGWRELLRLKNGSCGDHNECVGKFAGANFDFLSANVVVDETGQTLFPAYQIREFGGIKVAFVGVVLEGMDVLVTADAIRGVSFFDEAESVNALVPKLREEGVETIVVLIHEGGYPTGGFNECPGISGPIVDIANRLSDHVGVILSGHTHHAYNCMINNKLVTSAASNGRLITEIDVVLDPNSGKMLSAHADNVVVTRDVNKDWDQTELIKRYKDIAAPVANKVIGTITASLTKASNAAGESQIGRMLADAQLDAASPPEYGLAEIAFINPGGIRTDISYLSSNAHEGDGNVTYSEAYAVQPFGNYLITMTLLGSQLVELLEQQFAGCGFDQTRILQVSKSFRYAYRASAPPCQKIDRESLMVNDRPVDPSASYRIVANNFIAEGGDGFSVFKRGTERLTGKADIVALEAYLTTRSPLSADPQPRIKMVP